VTVTRSPWYLDFSKDGTLYTDEIDRPHEVLRLPEKGGTPEVMASSDYLRVPDLSYMDPVQITDGRTLFDTRLSGRGQVLVGTPGGNFFPLLETKEESSAPATSLPKDEVAFVLGSGDAQTIAIASADQGRLLRRLQGTKGKNIETLAASPDGNTLYYSSSGTVWAIPAIDGTPRQIAKGDNVAVDPNGRDLVIRRNEGSDSRLFRVSVSAGRTQQIPVPVDWSLAPVNIGQSAVAKNGKILIPVSPRDSWFYRLAILDPASGAVTRIPITYTGDTINGDWAGDGRILAVGLPLKGHIWRFTKVERGN
jgi:dipeptidyl aminopeptidase/acylaminoacyl peptidase